LIERRQNVDSAEKAILVGVVQKGQTEAEVHENLDELAFLAETAGAVSQKRFTQKLAKPDSRSFVGKGKLEEIKAYLANHEARVIIFDDELSGSQITHIEEVLDVKTIDRSDLILDIFARRAKTARAKAQVELAQYQYILPRLRGMWKHLERLGGGIGIGAAFYIGFNAPKERAWVLMSPADPRSGSVVGRLPRTSRSSPSWRTQDA